MNSTKRTKGSLSRWSNILLIEDNSARAERRRVAGLRQSRDAKNVRVRLHRIQSNNAVEVTERIYAPGRSRQTSVQDGKAALALELIDEAAAVCRRRVVVAGTSYGSNKSFIRGVLKRGIDVVVEVRPSAVFELMNGTKRVEGCESTAVSKLLDKAKWINKTIIVPDKNQALSFSVTNLGYVSIRSGEHGCLFAAQTGAIQGIHPGTIIGVTSCRDANLTEVLQAIVWARRIRHMVRRDERKARGSSSAEQRKKDSSSSTTVQARSNITLARRQDESTPWRQNESNFSQQVLYGHLSSASQVLNVVELFAGAGGMGLGFLLGRKRRSRYRLVYSAEVHPIYVESLQRNHINFTKQRRSLRGEFVPEETEPVDLTKTKSLRKIQAVAQEAGGVDVLVGGPPCQGFSNANRNSWYSGNPHNKLAQVYINYVERLKPRVFMMENVQGILWTPKDEKSDSQYSLVPYLARRLDAAGYLVFVKLLDAVWYGVPQYRSRLFVMGIHRDLGYRMEDFGLWGPFPLPTHGPGAPKPYATVRDAIADLPPIGNGHHVDASSYQEPKGSRLQRNTFLREMRAHAQKRIIFDHVTSRHAGYVIDRYRQIPPGGNWRSISHAFTNYTDVERTHSNIYRRLEWGEPSITIGHYRKSMLIHPEQHRGLSLREASRLQSFPDWFRFAGDVNGGNGGLSHKQQQLANAVCPLVSKAIAEYLLEL